MIVIWVHEAAHLSRKAAGVTLRPSHKGHSGFVYSTKLCWARHAAARLLLGAHRTGICAKRPDLTACTCRPLQLGPCDWVWWGLLLFMGQDAFYATCCCIHLLRVQNHLVMYEDRVCDCHLNKLDPKRFRCRGSDPSKDLSVARGGTVAL